MCHQEKKIENILLLSYNVGDHLVERVLCHILEKEQVNMFSENLVPQIEYLLEMQSLDTFHLVWKKG